ncbi:FAD-dependent oxidoreductase [Candidatus Peregrinibacteria bacterium]|nr:FAD-dependent oxidoreductase [Candidatus Peregrinibacteria bacterium]
MGESKSIYDVIIIGTGIAGCSAGMYCGRFNLKTLVIGELPGGIITTTHLVENYPGILSIGGVEMGEVFLKHAQQFGAEMKFSKVIDVQRCAPPKDAKKLGIFKVKTSSEEFIGKTVIFATGTEHKKLGVPGEKELNAKGVSYCALCDAAFFKEKTVCVVGGGDSSAIEALILAQQCKKVYMFVRKDVLRAEPINYKKVMESKNIEVRLKTEIAEVRGTGKVESVLLKSGAATPGKQEEISMDGVFVAIGHVALSGIAEKLGVALDEHKQIKINRNSETNILGVYAAGDVGDTAFKQAITGASEAVIASYFAYQYLQKNEFGYYCE